MLNIFIYYEEFQPAAFHIAAQSIIRHSSKPVSITPLLAKQVAKEYEFGPPHVNGIRFMPPCLCGFKGWAVFIDGSCMFTRDPYEMISEIEAKEDKLPKDEKHDIFMRKLPAEEETLLYKQLEMMSVIVFKCDNLTLMTADYLKKIAEVTQIEANNWLDPARFGHLGNEWNNLVHYEEQNDNVGVVNYAAGIPLHFGMMGNAADEEFAANYDEISAIKGTWMDFYRNSPHVTLVNNKLVPRFMVDMASQRAKPQYTDFVYNYLEVEDGKTR